MPRTNKLNLDEVMEAAQESMFGLENPGFCINCGSRNDGVEPDAREIYCDICEKPKVYGAEELLIYMA